MDQIRNLHPDSWVLGGAILVAAIAGIYILLRSQPFTSLATFINTAPTLLSASAGTTSAGSGGGFSGGGIGGRGGGGGSAYARPI